MDIPEGWENLFGKFGGFGGFESLKKPIKPEAGMTISKLIENMEHNARIIGAKNDAKKMGS